MKVYLFTSDFKLIEKLDKFGVDGVLYTYNAYQNNPFVEIPKNISKTNIKHMVAVRPYTVSPQFISQIGNTFDQIYGKGVLQINLISGWIKENEQNAGGIIGSVNDQSSSIDRSKYLTEYIDVLESLENKTVDYYVSVTNQFTFDKALQYDSKIIIHYNHFKENRYNIKDRKVMVLIDVVGKDQIILSNEELFKKLENLSKSGIKEVIFSGGDNKVMDHITNFIKKYKEKEAK